MARKPLAGDEAIFVSRSVHEFIDEYAPTFLTSSASTLKGYRDSMTLYFAFLEAEGVTPATLGFAHLERPWIERWVAWLRDTRRNSPDTCNNRLGALRRFLEYLGSRDATLAYLHVEAAAVKRQRPTKARAEGMSRDAVKALLAAPDTTTRVGRRDLAIMTLLYSCALRLGEVRLLTLGQVHLDVPKPYLTIRGKGGKVRTAYLMPGPAAILRAWLRDEMPACTSPDILIFASPVTGRALTEPAVDKRIKLYAKTAHEACADVPLRAHAHQLRHAKASHWLEDGMNIVEIKFLLGHENIETTMRYLDITTGDKAKALATLLDEGETQVARRWEARGTTLREICGLSRSGK
ncbi:MAG: tyrosine-type recombinase/integrase [Eggerthellaceae bacterium]|nr:tyrosine-type recombinase/integrase [Eggerthellaceae bacterium]